MAQVFEIGGRQLVVVEPTSRSLFKVKEVHTGVYYALKIYRQPPPLLAKQLRQEVTHLRDLNPHPHILTLHAYKDTPKAFFLLYDLCESKSYVEGSFAQWRPTLSAMSEQDALHAFYQLCLALCHMHRRAPAIVHRNITSKSVLLTSDSTLRLGGFTSSSQASSRSLLPSEVTTLSEELQLTIKKSWRPPELCSITENSQCTTKHDIWNLGEFLYFLLFGVKPFSDHRAQIAGSYIIPREVSSKIRDLLRMTIDPVYDRRGDITDVMTKILEQQPAPTQKKLLCCIPARNTHNGNRNTLFHPKKSTAKCILKLLNATQEPPKEKYVRKLVEKAWIKPGKIPKFYKELQGIKGLDLPQVRLKVLLCLHEYIRTAPLLCIQSSPGALSVLSLLEAHCPVQPGDPLRSDYFRQLTHTYCQALRAKVTIHNNYLTVFDGQFVLKQQLSELQASGPIKIQLIQDLMSCLKRMLRTMEVAMGQGTLLVVLRETVVKTLSNEITCLIQPLMSLITSWKHLSGQDSDLLISDFQSTYTRAQSLFQQVQDPRLSDPPPEFMTLSSYSSYSLLDSSPLSSYVSQQEILPVVPESQHASEFHTARTGSQAGSRNSFDLIDLTQEGIQSYAQRINESLQNWQIALDEVTMVRQIGAGASSEVWLGSYRKTAVAVKKIKMERIENGALREFSREVAALVQLRHPNLVLFMGAYLGSPLCVITEYCAGGDLYHLLHRDRDVFISWEQKLKMCLDIAKGMHFLHTCTPSIIHRDLKSLNLLVETPIRSPNDQVHIKVSDFGLAKALREREMMTGQLGTCVSDMQHWMAPEVLQSQSYTLKADVFSFGVSDIQIVMWEIITRKTPYEGMTVMDIKHRVLNQHDRPDITQIPPSCPDQMKQLMFMCWRTDPQKRPPFSSIVDILEVVTI